MVGECVQDLRNLSLCVSHIECKYYFYITFGYGNVGLIFLLVSKSTPATKNLAMTVTTKKKQTNKTQLASKPVSYTHLTLPTNREV